MNRKLIAVPAIVIAAGMSLAACGSSGSPYTQGKAFAVGDYNSGDQASIVGSDPMAMLQQWCQNQQQRVASGTSDSGQWVQACEAGYFQTRPSD